MRTVWTKLIAVWGGCVIASAIAASVTESWEVLTGGNGEVVVCETEWLDGTPIGCTEATDSKKCIKSKKEDGTYVYGKCTPWDVTYPVRGKYCPCL